MRFLLFIQVFLPRFLTKPLWSFFWKNYWQKQRKIELQELGAEASEKIFAGSERAEVLEKIVSEYPFESMLEVACSWGENFYALSELFPSDKFPNMQFAGIDKDEKAIEYGKNLFASRGVKNVSLHLTDARDLSMFEDNSFDIVVSCAFFLYVWPDDVRAVLDEMFRVARKKLIFLEQHKQNPKGNQNYIGTYCNYEGEMPGYWLKDYKSLLSKYLPESQITIQKIENPRWPQERWGEFASLVEVNLN